IIQELNDIKMGRFSEQLIKKTRLMLLNNALLSEDYNKNIIERIYTSSYIDSSYSIKNWIKGVNEVNKADIIKVANLLKLQTVYFLEGI
ncbi:TPA: insulinase family protein, partial [Streptococcus pyogenes]|nr:insulinase family protein [Streptococcus pyogenes]